MQLGFGKRGSPSGRALAPWAPTVLLVGCGCLALALGATRPGRSILRVQVPPSESSTSPASTKRYPVHIRKPTSEPRVATGQVDHSGKPLFVNCNLCHSARQPNVEMRVGQELKAFHQGLKGQHGDLTCVSCHQGDNGYQSLRLADGRSLPFSEVMTLCAQCHGTQFREYQHGAHGGMTGFWDLTRGGRSRNNCIDCHDPHLPRYPRFRPAEGPRDRGLEILPGRPGDPHD